MGAVDALVDVLVSVLGEVELVEDVEDWVVVG